MSWYQLSKIDTKIYSQSNLQFEIPVLFVHHRESDQSSKKINTPRQDNQFTQFRSKLPISPYITLRAPRNSQASSSGTPQSHPRPHRIYNTQVAMHPRIASLIHSVATTPLHKSLVLLDPQTSSRTYTSCVKRTVTQPIGIPIPTSSSKEIRGENKFDAPICICA